ncbi:hypothetical protein P152DRAFT_458546 [Eremomyces bilateralis CBS 781.70]|uniref:Uncharacterized protein n=1 Tax=Eremomyces bilateralis CBS 781.70 TaxID=1392243 RepID=A0A6G1G2I3_9PEZI|nr:uncharacterized protein P152DRAFT_458546 [Eremomyces bilateralis CBS 781.70]KAF1812136.1 hypothetical protein P152DRAFT_458546 [Eremomyces bilateralis CBS 781.70]
MANTAAGIDPALSGSHAGAEDDEPGLPVCSAHCLSHINYIGSPVSDALSSPRISNPTSVTRRNGYERSAITTPKPSVRTMLALRSCPDQRGGTISFSTAVLRKTN